jgi:hypothetical protein
VAVVVDRRSVRPLRETVREKVRFERPAAMAASRGRLVVIR